MRFGPGPILTVRNVSVRPLWTATFSARSWSSRLPNWIRPLATDRASEAVEGVIMAVAA